MVRLAEKPSLRDASCCKVDVVKGAAGVNPALRYGVELHIRIRESH